MKTLPLSEVKARLSELVDAVSRRDERVMITRNGRPAAILISPHEFESWEATVEITSDPEFLADVRRGIRELDKGKGRRVDLDELFGPER